MWTELVMILIEQSASKLIQSINAENANSYLHIFEKKNGTVAQLARKYSKIITIQKLRVWTPLTISQSL